MGFQHKIRTAVYWVHVGSTFLIWALPTVLPVSNLALQRFCPEAKSLSSTVSISSEVNSSRCAGPRSLGDVCLWMAHISLFLSPLCFLPLFLSFLFFHFASVFPFVLSSSLYCHPFVSLTSSEFLCFLTSAVFASLIPWTSRCSHKKTSWADERKKTHQKQERPITHRPHKDICQNIQIRFWISFIGNAFFCGWHNTTKLYSSYIYNNVNVNIN